LILFTDALGLDLRGRAHRGLALLALGPGTLLAAALFAAAAWWLLDFSLPAAAIVGAALASTDPVLLKGLLRRPDLPTGARQALRLESGLNDVVLLPIVLVALPFLSETKLESASWAKLGLDLFLLGPGAGVLVGLFGLATLDLMRRRFGVRRDYESLYSLGIAFAAFAAAESVHGSGFLAAFAAGLTIALFDVELCDCFKEYGETTAELALLLTFVLLGGSLIWSGVSVATGLTLLFAGLVLLGRPAIYLAAFAPTRVERPTRLIVAWFGPRGLSSLLLALLPVSPGAEPLFRVCLIVLVSCCCTAALAWTARRAAGGRRGRGADPVDTLRALFGTKLVVGDARRDAWRGRGPARGAALLAGPPRRRASSACPPTPGSCSTAPDRTRHECPCAREPGAPAGKRRGHWSAASAPGARPACRWNRRRREPRGQAQLRLRQAVELDGVEPRMRACAPASSPSIASRSSPTTPGIFASGCG
jgi:NhaP-type Na+/H+ or K+/H+ antiporter